ncbi:MAG: iron ABC transporter permease [Caulobacteraceae bacterium]|nr:iron ABC transporter permease [Caulobacteraceae bacterium]
MRRAAPLNVIFGLLVLLAVLCAISLIAGRVWIPLDRLGAPGDPQWAIITELRIPRTLLALAIGAALGLSGAVLQGYTRNPLADPGVLGVSSMGSLGAVLTLYFNLTAPGETAAFAIAGSAVGVLVLLGLTGSAGGATTFLLAGVVLNVIAEAGVSLALMLSPDPWAASEIVTWLLGSLSDRSFTDVWTATPFIVAGGAALLMVGRDLDALTLGETGARSLGVSLGRTQALIAAGVGLACGASVAVSGVIGFVGLIVPHLMRGLVGGRPSSLLVPSALAGAALLLAADILVRLIPAASEVRLGVAMAVLGGPFFLWRLIAIRRRFA